MQTDSYIDRRKQLTTYFDQTASSAWEALTSDKPVSRIRQTVRAGRDDMRATLLDYLPSDLTGRRILDAGCGTGALAVEAAKRGADVVAVDVAESLVDVARRRIPPGLDSGLGEGSVEFIVGDMLNDGPGEFDHVVAMDSLIHYATADTVDAVAQLCRKTRRSMVFTFAPRTAPLALMHFVGRFVPQRSDRSPAIVPTVAAELRRELENALASEGWTIGRSRRVKRGFYISQSQELKRQCND